MENDFNKSDSLRIGLLGIYHESNTFIEAKTEWENFQNGHLLWGNDILEEYGNAYHEIGGAVEVFSQRKDVEMIPLFYAEATPGGIISNTAAERLLKELKNSLKEVLPLDGIMVFPHGAAVSENYSDFDGYWMQLIREKVGKDIPIVGTIDPHCNLSFSMIRAVDSLVAYKTNPHIDQRQVGKEASEIMLNILDKKIKPTIAATQTRVAISIEMQHTASSPCLELYEFAHHYLISPTVLSISIVLGFPYADVEEMGTSFIVVTENDQEKADRIAIELKNYLEENHALFSGEKVDIKDLSGLVENAQKPLLLLDMGDNVGGGSPGDSTFLLQYLEQMPFGRGFMCICDPSAVELFEQLNEGENLAIEIGGKTDQFHGKPVKVTAKLIAIVKGKFFENEPRHGGQISFNMGKTAIIETSHGNTLMLTSLRIAPFSLQQLLAFGIDPRDFDVLVAKGVHAPLAAYMSACKSLIRVNTPGVTQANIVDLSYTNRRKPLFPFEKINN